MVAIAGLFHISMVASRLLTKMWGIPSDVGASPSSLAGEHAPEPASSAAAATWRGQVDIHVAQRVPRSRFVEQQEPDLDAVDATSAESSAAADALTAAAK